MKSHTTEAQTVKPSNV